MTNHYKFFVNKKCEYFPCHVCIAKEDFNCLFCYCLLYPYKECGGSYVMLENGWKDCSNCRIPHQRKNYDYIVEKLIELSPKLEI